MNPEKEMQWLDYRMARSNAIWFCKQTPMRTENTDCTAKDLKINTEKWITEAIGRWRDLVREQHPDALRVVELLTGEWTTKAESSTSVRIANSSGHPDKCLCPKCMLAEIAEVQNLDLKLAIPEFTL